ncbi:MAG: bifunctional riboflavin kinase/FMN adenylyltransferase, partial [Clostridiaceae bacterium]|nr:bifunctional riboflavin kinase/FMN adenylyltransferase [Clostridiaceae bacterium]
MNVIYGSSDERVLINPAGVGLGNFDGLHVGHMELVNTLISESKASFLNSVVYTFTKHPENIIRKSLFTPLITTFDKKVELLGRTNLDYLYFEEFDENFSRMKPEEFVKSILVERLNIKLAVAGEDYRFGYMGQGNTDLLYKLGQRYGFRVLIIPPVKIDDNVVSSTLIRKFILKGYMDKVE